MDVGSRRTMGLQCVLRRRETLGCVWTIVLTCGKDGGLWLRVYVGIKKKSLQIGLFLWLWSLSLRFGCTSGKPPNAWAGSTHWWGRVLSLLVQTYYSFPAKPPKNREFKSSWICTGLMIALITWNSNLVLLLEGLRTSNPCRFEFSVFWVFAGNELLNSGLTAPRSDQLS